MGVPNLAVVLICVLAAGAVVTVGAAFGRQLLPRRFGGTAGNNGDEERDWTRMPPEQEAYCRSVREANQMALFAQTRQQRRPVDYEAQSGYMSHAASERGGYGHATYSTDQLPQQHMQQQYAQSQQHWDDVEGR